MLIQKGCIHPSPSKWQRIHCRSSVVKSDNATWISCIAIYFLNFLTLGSLWGFPMPVHVLLPLWDHWLLYYKMSLPSQLIFVALCISLFVAFSFYSVRLWLLIALRIFKPFRDSYLWDMSSSQLLHHYRISTSQMVWYNVICFENIILLRF